MSKIVISNRVYVPAKLIDKELLLQHYQIRLYNESACAKCPLRPDRHTDDCDSCNNFEQELKLYRTKKIKGVDYYALPPGDLKALQSNLDISLKGAKDIRPVVPFKTKGIKFTGKLFTGKTVKGRKTVNQKRLIKLWWKRKSGTIQAAPRSGKCIVGSSLVQTNKGLLPIRELFDKNHPDGYLKPVSNIEVMTPKGFKPVSHLYKKKVKQTIKIKTALGYSVHGTFIHPVLVFTPRLAHVWKNLEDIKIGDMLCISRNTKNKTTKTVREDLSKLLGFLVANGDVGLKNRRFGRFHSNNPRVQKEFKRCFKSFFGKKIKFTKCEDKTAFVKLSKRQLKCLESYGLTLEKAAKKKIPNIIMCSDKQSIKNYLSAYLSCDSYVTHKANELELCTASKAMAHQLQILLSHFNIHGRFDKYWAFARNSKTPVNRLYWSIYFNGEAKHKLLRLIKWYKPVQKYTYKDNGRYLLTALPYVRHRMLEFIRNFSIGGGYYNYKGKKVLQKIPYASSGDKNLVSRTDFKNKNWKPITKFVSAFDSKLSKNITKLLNTDFIYSPVVSKKIINKKTTVYDLSVPSTHSFIANGVVVHNTVTAAAAICKLGVRTIVLVDQKELLKQFLRTFVGDKTHPAMTNIPELRKKTGKPIVGIIDKIEDINKYDIALLTYQKLIQKKTAVKRLKKYINGDRTLLIIDEAHGAAATAYATLLSRLKIKYRMMLTATPRRKDGRDTITAAYAGPVVAIANTVSLTPRIELVETGVYTKYKYSSWVYAMKYLAKHKKRMELIVREVFKDLRAGHKCIIIPVDYKDQAFALQKIINQQAALNNEKRGEMWPTKTADVLHAKADRENFLFNAEAGKIPVLISIRKMIKQGIDVSLPTRLYCIVPMSAKPIIGAPFFQQLSYRVATYLKDKKDPTVKIFIDGLSPFSTGCWRSLFFHEILPGLKASPGNPPKYRMESADFERGMQIAKSSGYVPINKPAERKTSQEILRITGGTSGKLTVAGKAAPKGRYL